jgi:integrase
MGNMGTASRLTQRTVERATCPSGRKDVLVFDREVRGFGLRITAAGAKIFLAQYRTATGKRRVPIGRFGVLTVDEARKRAKAILGNAAEGRDPFAESKAQAEAARRAKIEAEYSFGALVDAWAEARADDRRHSYLREAVACLRRNLPEWLRRPANALMLSDAVRAIDCIKAGKGTVAANRTLAYGRAAYSWAIKRQRLAANPFRGIERAGREAPRERVLSDTELGAIWCACGGLNATAAGFVRMLMLTLQRREEVAGMHWTELDNGADPAVWTVPPQRAKNGRGHIVHLTEPARAIIRDMPRIVGNPFVFVAPRGGSLAGFSRTKYRIDTALVKAGTPVIDWCFHDFRRSGVTALASMGFPPHVADKLLNHVTGAIRGVAAVYQRHEFLNERKAALDAWAAHVLAAADQCEMTRNMGQLRIG